MVRVTVSRGDAAIPVPHVTNVVGISDENGRFDIWDAVNRNLAYTPDGQVTVNWADAHLPRFLRGKVTITHSPGGES